MPFIWQGVGISEVRGGRSHGVKHDPRGVAPAKGRKWEASGKAPEGKPLWSLWKGLWPGTDNQAELLQNALPRIWPWGLPWSISHIPGDGYFCWPSWLWCPWSPGCVDWPEGPLGHPLGGKNLSKRYLLLLGSAPIWDTQDHGLERDLFPGAPEMMDWPVILPQVWQGGAEWGCSGESLRDKSLQSGPHLQLVLWVFHDQHQHNAPSCAAVPISTHPQWQQWWWLQRWVRCWEQSRRWWLYIYLGPFGTWISLFPMFMPGWASLASSQQSCLSCHSLLHVTQLQWGKLPLKQLTIQYHASFITCCDCTYFNNKGNII